MGEETINKTGNVDAGQEFDLHHAITKLFLDLRGDGTVEALAKKIGVPRKRLGKIFEVYQAHLEGTEVPRSKTDPRNTRLYWELDPLIEASRNLNIPVSDIIRAAEDVQEGLPPWFHVRISKNTSPRTKEELTNIILEAVGCRTYAMDDPLDVRGERRSFKHNKTRPFPRNSVIVLQSVIDSLFGNGGLKEFLDAYEDGTITNVEAYRELKEVIDSVIGAGIADNVKDEVGVVDLANRIVLARDKLTEKIASATHRLLEQKKHSSQAR